MNDCAVLEQSQSHFVEPLIGSIISTVLIAVSLLFFNVRMALAAIWVLPVAFIIVGTASNVQKKLSQNPWQPKWRARTAYRNVLKPWAIFALTTPRKIFKRS